MMDRDQVSSQQLALLAATLLLGASCAATEGGPAKPARPSVLVEGEPMYTVLPKDSIQAIDEPVFVSAVAAAAFMSDSETVIGVVGAGGTARCYSAWQLDSNEIVNDTLDGRPIAATW